MKGKAADYHMLVTMIREIKVPRDRFRCVLVVFFYVTKLFSESVAKSSPCFANVLLFAKSASYAVDDICRGTLEQKFIFQIGSLNPNGINERFSFN